MSATLTPAPLQVHLGDPLWIAELLERPGVLRTGHFRLLSGMHSDRFIRFSGLAKDPTALARIADLLAAMVAVRQPSSVLAPSTAGVSLAREVSGRLGLRVHLAGVGEDGRPDTLLGEPPAAGDRLLLINDVITTGDGMRALAQIAKSFGAAVAAAAAFLTRTDASIDERIGAPTSLLATLPLSTWTPEECPLCRDGGRPEDARDLN